MDTKTEKKAAKKAFDGCAAGGDTMALADLGKVLAAIGQPQELESALDVIGYVKRTSFDASPDGRLSWSELETWLGSDGRDKK